MTEKMKFETKDLTQENIAKIGQLFPEVLTEAKDDNGTLKKAIDFDKLRQILSDSAIDNRETYDFTWVGKKQAILEAATPIRKTLRPCKEESVNWDTTQNLYIEGDNLDVLKLLQESYLGKVKMIYIDPPYNTGNDFIYKDDFAMSQEEYEESGERIDESGNRLVKNTDSNGRFHSDWCSMMYPRLKLARNLLTDDGVIFISIDDNEVTNLRKLCDEVFGAENFVNSVSIKMSELSGVKMKYLKKFAKLKETLLVYGKNILNLNLVIEKKRKEGVALNSYLKYYSKVLENASEDCSKWKVTPLAQYLKNYNSLSEEEINQWKIQNADKLVYRTNSKTITSYIRSNPNSPTFLKLKNADGNEIVKWEDKEMLFLDKYLEEYIGDIWLDISTINLNKETGSIVFENGQKPLALLERIIRAGSTSGDIIIDFFSGSATTAHAVMRLNAEDGGKRQFIMVQLPEECDKTSEAYKAGYKNICEIGKERIRRAAKQIKEEHPESNFDGGFRVFKLADSNMKDVYYNPAEYTQDLLDKMTSNIKEDRNDMDLLYGCMLEWGLPLSYPHTSEKVGSYTIHTVNNGDLVACFDENVTEDIIRHIAAKKPLRVVFRDAGFTDSPAKINVGELFKLLSPDTKVKVI